MLLVIILCEIVHSAKRGKKIARLTRITRTMEAVHASKRLSGFLEGSLAFLQTSKFQRQPSKTYFVGLLAAVNADLRIRLDYSNGGAAARRSSGFGKVQ